MIASIGNNGDSFRREVGSIPGLPDIAAGILTGDEPSSIPILIAVPHAGRAYGSEVLEAMRNPENGPLRLEDRYADRLAAEVSKATGAWLLTAQAPRAMIDLNRAPDDIDWEMVSAAPPHRRSTTLPNSRARSGLGLIPRRLPGVGEVWKRPLPFAQIEERIAAVHAPWHQAIDGALHELRSRWGAALLIDFHSMPTLLKNGAEQPATIVLGDRFGASCHGEIAATAFAYMASEGCVAAHNRPYAGGYGLERHAAPSRGIHAVQLEIDRGAYLDSRLSEPGSGFDSMAELLTGLVRHLAASVAAAGQGSVQASATENWPLAAE